MESKPIFYSVWLINDQKWSALVLGLLMAGGSLVIWQYSGLYTLVIGLVLALLTIWHIFVPVRLEINSNGIVRSVFGRKWFIAWSDIHGYQIRYNGLLLFTHRDRFLLEPFCAFFLPVPKGLMTEVLYHFRLFVGE